MPTTDRPTSINASVPTTPPTATKTTIRNGERRLGHEQRAPQPDAVGDRPEHEGADRAGHEHQRELAAPLRRRPAVGDDPERHEREQREPGDAPKPDYEGEQEHRAGIVLAGRHPAAAPGRGEPPQRGQHPQQDERERHHRDHREQAPLEPEPDARAGVIRIGASA